MDTNKNLRSFTLIELLVVLALVAILSVVVILTLNPAELLKQARDSNRLSDLATINTALNLFSTDVIGGFMGTSTVVYVSLPDNSSSTCGSWGLPALPTGYTYNCVTSQNLRNTDGSGWIPVNFQRISSNSPISQLPIDPTNTTSTGSYYTYVTGGSWQLTNRLESQKYGSVAYASGGTDPTLNTIGTNISLAPFVGSLVGWWGFEESGTSTVFDGSGYGHTGTMYSSTTLIDIHSNSGCKAGSGCVAFDVVDDFVNTPGTVLDNLATDGDFSVSGWIKTTSSLFAVISQGYGAHGSGRWLSGGTAAKPLASVFGGASSPSYKTASGQSFASGNSWNNITSVFSRSSRSVSVYFNGNLEGSGAWDGYVEVMQTGRVNIGKLQQNGSLGGYLFRGYIDDVRAYKKALSASEVMALYNSAK